jgi:hypothetical protein
MMLWQSGHGIFVVDRDRDRHGGTGTVFPSC